MSNSILDILQRLNAIEEGTVTPTRVKHGLNRQQRSVPQLPALFKPKSITALGNDHDPQHPMKGYAVGGAAESREHVKNALAEHMAEIEEDMLSKVRRDLNVYLDKLERRSHPDRDLIDKAKDAVRKRKAEEEQEVEEDPTTQEPTIDAKDLPQQDPVTAEAEHIRSYMLEDGSCVECWGNDQQGYQLRHGDRIMKTKFSKPDHADIAMKLWLQRRRDQQQSADYVEEK